MGGDMLSSLPDDVIQVIFKYLPIREAVRTSLLSTTWRYKWLLVEDLIFDARSLPPSVTDRTDTKLANFVNQVLLLRDGPVSKFEVNNYLETGCPDVDRWILILSRTNLTHLVLAFRSGDRYRIPSSLYFCKFLTYLKLCHCILKPPSTFRGFSNLTALDLQQVNLTTEVFENVMSKSPILRRLQLISCNGFSHLKISAPNLEYLFFHGKFDSLCFDDVSHLVDVTISLCNLPDGGGRREVSRLEWYLRRLDSMKRLVIYNQFLKFLAVDIVPEKLPHCFTSLKYLRLHINIEDSKQMLAAFCMFRSSPNLEHIRIDANSNKYVALLHDESFWDSSPSLDITFLHVKKVEVVGFIGSQHELDFVQFVLMNSSLLETMIIKLDKDAHADNSKQLAILKKMMRFRRASPRAEVSILDA